MLNRRKKKRSNNKRQQQTSSVTTPILQTIYRDSNNLNYNALSSAINNRLENLLDKHKVYNNTVVPERPESSTQNDFQRALNVTRLEETAPPMSPMITEPIPQESEKQTPYTAPVEMVDVSIPEIQSPMISTPVTREQQRGGLKSRLTKTGVPRRNASDYGYIMENVISKIPPDERTPEQQKALKEYLSFGKPEAKRAKTPTTRR